VPSTALLYHRFREDDDPSSRRRRRARCQRARAPDDEIRSRPRGGGEAARQRGVGARAAQHKGRSRDEVSFGRGRPHGRCGTHSGQRKEQPDLRRVQQSGRECHPSNPATPG